LFLSKRWRVCFWVNPFQLRTRRHFDDPGYRDLLRHMQIGFLSKDGLSLSDEHFRIQPESVWQCAAEVITNLPPPPLDSPIILDFPGIVVGLRGKRFSLL
jgi:hypothetical protein